MANRYQVIDETKWKRAMHCMVFRNSVEPAFCVTFEADITNFKRKVKERGFSFTIAMVYAVCKCANEIEAFRYRFLDGKVVLFDNIDTAFTYLNDETELFKVVNVPMTDNIKDYVELATKTAKEQKEYFTGPLENDVFQCSPMPWVTYTHISHTNSGKKDNATPLFGGNIMRKTASFIFRFQYRHIIHLLTDYILVYLLKSCKDFLMNTKF